MASTGNNPTDPGPGAGTTQTGSATDTARREGEHLTDRAREKAGELRQQAEHAAHDMRDRARSAVDHQKDAAVGRIEGVAHALRSASDDLRDRGQPMVAEYSRHLAEGLESMADSLGRRNVDDLVGGIEDFARQRPVAFLGGAMVAGFALARFMKSSSARRYRPGAGEYRGQSHGGEFRGQSGAGEYRGQPGATAGPGSAGATAWPGGASTPSPGSTGTSGAGRYDRPTEGGI